MKKNKLQRKPLELSWDAGMHKKRGGGMSGRGEIQKGSDKVFSLKTICSGTL